MVSLSRSAGAQRRVVDFAVDVRAADPPSWLVERLTERLDGPYLRAAMRPERPSLVEAMREVIR